MYAETPLDLSSEVVHSYPCVCLVVSVNAILIFLKLQSLAAIIVLGGTIVV